MVPQMDAYREGREGITDSVNLWKKKRFIIQINRQSGGGGRSPGILSLDALFKGKADDL